MSYKFLFLFFLIYLSSTYCSECTEKTSFEEGGDKFHSCYELSTIDYFCHYNEEKEVCEELTCDNSPAELCDYIPPNSVDGIEKKCIPKSDKTGCEYKTCEDLTSNCNKFYTGNEDQICTLNSSGDKCEIKSCSSLTSNCEQLTPYSSNLKCALIADGSCQIMNKECEDYKSDECEDYYSPSNDDPKQCLLDSSTNKCKKFSCEELPKTECSKFKINEENKVCASDGNNCKIQSCEDFSSEICESIEFSNDDYKCVNSDSGCTFTTCLKTEPPNCGKFVPTNKAFKCYFSRHAQKCVLESKDCEEFSKGECNLFNTEKNLDGTDGKKCVEDDGKCVLNSKKLEFSTFFILILFFVF